ncbi:deoxyribonuclease gamma-like isoform X7 [Dicentrarchus labrax]|uniref:deoxyribonuclease gamma-like isoform X7 n=1 Tax=Dicentrarchus labrax TaxID=13489 RepID=UPI0021F60A6E|nr:deoxyribonuclease gamma-like isoform X7 [Dicentrarchus labrax]
MERLYWPVHLFPLSLQTGHLTLQLQPSHQVKMKIAAFNVQRLGMDKVGNKDVREKLIKEEQWAYTVWRLGANSRSEPVVLHSARPCPSPHPLSPVQLGCTHEKGIWKALFVKDLVLIPVHTKPEDAEIELDALEDVVEVARKKWKSDNIMILGDFNADGRYLSKKEKKRISIFSPDYHWLIGDDVDTTTSNSTDHTYDRIVVFGDDMYDAVVPRSARAFNFQKEYRLSDAKTKAISDHYPVEVVLREN